MADGGGEWGGGGEVLCREGGGCERWGRGGAGGAGEVAGGVWRGEGVGGGECGDEVCECVRRL